MASTIDPRGAAFGVIGIAQYRGRAGPRRIETSLEQFDQLSSDRRIVDERPLDVTLAVRGPGLAQVLGVGTQHVCLPPGQAGDQDQSVEPVLLDLVVPQQAKSVDDLFCARTVEVAPGWQAQSEVVDPGCAAVGAADFVRPLVEYLDVHLVEDGQGPSQAQRLAGTEDFEPTVGLVVRRWRVHLEGQPVLVIEGLQARQVVHCGPGREVLLVRLRKRSDVPAQQPLPGVLAGGQHDEISQVVTPPSRDPGHFRLDQPTIRRRDRGPRRAVR